MSNASHGEAQKNILDLKIISYKNPIYFPNLYEGDHKIKIDKRKTSE
jgi:hypothetical protein